MELSSLEKVSKNIKSSSKSLNFNCTDVINELVLIRNIAKSEELNALYNYTNNLINDYKKCISEATTLYNDVSNTIDTYIKNSKNNIKNLSNDFRVISNRFEKNIYNDK